MDCRNVPRRSILISVVLALVTLAVYLPAAHHPFINYDDPEYVTQNQVVQQGLTWQGIGWAFNGSHSDNWHPLTWLSHMFDAEMYGLKPGGHHFTNVLFHVANSVLLFWLFQRVTGAVWKSTCVAALFAFHPLHVESVAWVSERKDVLSGFFGLLALYAYARYTEGSKAEGPKSKGWYVTALVFFGLGLMSKPMLVTLPFLMLLLDFWPLRRVQLAPGDLPVFGKLVKEKVPFFVFTLLSCIITFWAQQAGGAVVSLDWLPFTERVANAVVSYVVYLKKSLWPVDLAVFYPHASRTEWPELLVAALIIGAISVYTALNLKRRPFLLTGWLWYLGSLVPVLGLVQVGIQSYADRYMYLPVIGLVIMLVWGAETFLPTPRASNIVAFGAVSALVACAALSAWQLTYWKDTKTLFSHARAVTKGNCVAATVLGEELVKEKNYEAALPLFREAVSYRPNYLEARLCYGKAILEQSKFREAADIYAGAIAIAPDSARAHFGLASALAFQRRFFEAIAEYRGALQLKPEYWEAQLGLAQAEMSAGRFNEACIQLHELVAAQPTNVQAHFSLGSCLSELGQTNEAQQHYATTLSLDSAFADKLFDSGKAMVAAGQADGAAARFMAVLSLRPDYADAHEQLGLLLAQRGEIDKAILHFTEAVRLHPNAQGYYNLALASSMQGNKTAAINYYRDGLALKPDWPQALNDLAWILATDPNAEHRNGAEAIELAKKACELTQSKEPRYLGTLDACYAEAGRFEEAVATAKRAESLASQGGQTEVAEAAAARLKLYDTRQPYRQQ